MLNIETLKEEIVKRLKPLNPNQIILFGSYANGTPHQYSDIDLYVVTNDDYIPTTFKENMNLKLQVSRTLKDLQKIIPIDIITHTKKMHQNFLKLNNSFSKEILENGVKLYG